MLSRIRICIRKYPSQPCWLPNRPFSVEAPSLKNRRVPLVTGLTIVAIIASISYRERIERSERIRALPVATPSLLAQAHPKRDFDRDIVELVQRMGLMGKRKSLRQELVDIRDWHHRHGYRGGLVVRDLTRPLWGETIAEIIEDPTVLNRRECYFLYYEIQGDGMVHYQIVCRGTTLAWDAWTCLQAWMVYDPELGCRIHRGFQKHAETILIDVIPLLTGDNRRMGVEICGHSLGGAVASIIAAKLRKRGYQVNRLTTVGEARYCASSAAADRMKDLLPEDRLRIENDNDVVPFLPPFGAHVPGNKLWLTNDHLAHYVTTKSIDWADSVWTNLRIESFFTTGKAHRIPEYVRQLSAIREGYE